MTLFSQVSAKSSRKRKSIFITQLLHKGGPFINSLLHLEELGFRSSSPATKKIAFIAWKSLIDNFALNPGVTLYLWNLAALVFGMIILKLSSFVHQRDTLQWQTDETPDAAPLVHKCQDRGSDAD